MEVKAGTFDVFESGSVHSKGMEPTEFLLAPQMVLRVVVDQTKESPPKIALDPMGNALVVTFTNPYGQMHFGPQVPMHIGALEGRRLYCMLRLNTFGEYSSYSIDYTFYLGEKVQ